MGNQKRILVMISMVLAATMACRAAQNLTTEPTTPIPSMTATATKLPPRPVTPGEENPDEPVYITGDIPFTSPFFLDTLAEAFVLLEDQKGFIQRDIEFEFSLESQVIGPVELVNDEEISYQLALPSVPQGFQTDLDNDEEADIGVQVFAVAYWSNTWGGPFLEERDGTGWSSGYASTTTDADREYEIDGGILVVWSPDDEQGFPTGYGEDGKLFTADDPTAPIPAGYTIVDLDTNPFNFFKEARPHIVLREGDTAVNDLSALGYVEAFDALHEQVAIEYPFTEEKGIDWTALYDEYAPDFAEAKDDEDFFWALKAYSMEIPDGHVGVGYNDEVGRIFFENYGVSFGMILAELDNGEVIVIEVLEDAPAARAGIEVGAEIIAWNEAAISDAISRVKPFFGPYSTSHYERFEQLVFLTRVAPDEVVEITYQNPADEVTQQSIRAEIEYDSLFLWIPSFAEDELRLPVTGEVLDDVGLGYIKISSFSDDYNLSAQLWDRYMNELIDAEVPGIILDMRVNGGGSTGLARGFAGYFFDDEITLSQSSYYSDLTGQFEYRTYQSRIEPGPIYFDGPIAILVGPYCVSACEGFTYALTQRSDVIVVGHAPTAGAYGEVGRGQYDLPADLSMQFPTGRSETLDGELLIEGTGVAVDILVPVTRAGALAQIDEVLNAAIEALME